MKKCNVCNQEKPLTEFFDKGKSKDCKCKVCRLAYNRDRYAKAIAPHTKNYTHENVETKVCLKCGVEKSVTEFSLHHVNVCGASKYRPECNTCRKEWREANKGEHKISQRLYRFHNKEKIKKDRERYFSNPENRERSRLYAREYAKRHPQKQRDWLLSKYGLTQQDYDKMLESQNHCCAICGKNKNGKKKNFVVDHDHDTDIVRGLLCTQCNAGLGNFKDSHDLLNKAINYLTN